MTDTFMNNENFDIFKNILVLIRSILCSSWYDNYILISLFLMTWGKCKNINQGLNTNSVGYCMFTTPWVLSPCGPWPQFKLAIGTLALWGLFTCVLYILLSASFGFYQWDRFTLGHQCYKAGERCRWVRLCEILDLV